MVCRCFEILLCIALHIHHNFGFHEGMESLCDDGLEWCPLTDYLTSTWISPLYTTSEEYSGCAYSLDDKFTIGTPFLSGFREVE